MSTSVESKVVELKFDNAAFEAAARISLLTLDKLNKSIESTGKTTGLENISAAAKRINLNPLATSIESVSRRFLALSTVAVTALSNITTRAIDAGSTLVKSLTVDPIASGLKEYETNLNSIQTILANTQASGATLGDVSAALDELNTYSDKTIYNFSEMARNIGTFTAAGVGLDKSVASIKGIANLAALSGSNSQQASTAMYQLSQAISSGRVALQDWNSVVNAGMGGTVFQRALAQTAEKMGTLEKGSVKLKGEMKNVSIAGESFRQSIQGEAGKESWLTSDVLTKTLAQFTGDLTDADLAAQGFTKSQIKAIQAQAKTAQEAATKVKTLSQTIDVAKETAQSGWAQTWRTIFGDFNEARSSFTSLSETVNGFITKQADARNAMLASWDAFGGRDAAIDALKNAFSALESILKPIKDAFREIFPAKTGKDLYDMTVAVRDFFANIKLSEPTMDLLKRTFKGLFAIMDIGKMVVGEVFGVFKKLFMTAGEGGGAFLETTASIGDFFVKLRDSIKYGDGLKNFFETLGDVLAKPVELLTKFAGALAEAFGGDTTILSDTADGIERIGDSLDPFGRLVSGIVFLWEGFYKALEKTAPFLSNLVAKVGEAFSGIGQAITDSLSNGNFDAALDVINTVLLGGIVVLLKKFVDNGLKFNIGDNLFGKSGEAIDALTGSLKAMETQIKAKSLLMIAGAVALLVASLVLLSTIDSKKLAVGLGGLSVVFGQLLAAMAILTKIAGAGGFLKIPLIAGSLILLATAVLILTAAVKVLSTMDWEELSKGLLGLGAILGMIMVAVGPIGNASPKIIAASAAMILLGVALNIMAVALKVFATMSWEDIGKGLATVAGLMAVLAATMSLMPGPSMLITGAALVFVATALNILAGALAIMGSFDPATIVKGLLTMGGALLIIAGAMSLMPGPMMLLTAAGLLIVSVALNGVAAALKIMGSMSVEEIAKSLIVLAGALAIIAGGLYLMSGTILGSAALLVAAGALAVLAPVLVVLGQMSWENILKGLVALAGAFLVIGLAGLLLTPIIPSIIGLGAAVALLGVGLALAGVGVLAFATGITLLIAAAGTGMVAITAIITGMIGLIPTVMRGVSIALIEFSKAIVAALPEIAKAITAIIIAILDIVIESAPKVGEAMGVLLDTLLDLIVEYVPKIVVAAYKLITGLINGIASRVKPLAAAAVNLMVQFIQAWADEVPKLVDAGAKAIIDFVNGLAKAIDDNAEEMGRAGGRLAAAIVTGMVKGIWGGLDEIKNAASEMGSNILSTIGDVLGIASPSKEFIKIGKYITQGLVIGIASGKDDVINTMSDLGKVLKDTVKSTKDDVKDAREELKRLKEEASPNDKEIKKAKKALAQAIKLHEGAADAQKLFAKGMAKQRAQLVKLGAQYDEVSTKLEAAKDVLEDAQRDYEDFKKSTTDNFDDLPDITQETSLDTYFDQIRESTVANKKFLETLNKLRDLGLDETSYRKFLEQGVETQPFLDALLSSGASTIEELSKIDKELADSAASIGLTAADELYKAGVDAAQGLVDGLEKQMDTIIKQMEKIGKAMADAIKKELGIKSPSRVFMKVGKWSVEGLAEGIENNSNVVDLASRRVAKGAVAAMQKTISDMSSAMDTDLNLNPTIAPVLDLTDFRKEAVKMQDALGQPKITPAISGATSQAIAAETEAARAEEAEFAMASGGDTIQFVQTNTSPKALSTAEIYRNTKNQISSAKGVLRNAKQN